MKKDNHRFTFIDLFAGIGGFHIAMHRLGGKCVFASEIDKYARKTYKHNFYKIVPELFDEKLFNKDIRKIVPSEIPDFDVLCGGFPCQPFSQAGYKRGFADNHKSERGNLFFYIAEILEVKKPKAFFLENVRGLFKHDSGKTFEIIRKILEDELGYSFYYKIVHASDYGLPQLRPRLFMIGFRDESFMKGFTFPEKKVLKYNMSDIWGGECNREIGYTMRVGGRGSTINDRRNWDAYLVDGEVKQLGIEQGKLLQGFPEDFEFPVSNTQAMKQLGNSVAIDAVEAVANQMICYLESNIKSNIKNTTMGNTYNKGEWSELLVFIKMLAEKKIILADSNLTPKDYFFYVDKVTTRNLSSSFYVLDEAKIKCVHKETKEEKIINAKDILTKDKIASIIDVIKTSKGTFNIEEFDVIQNLLGFDVVKGGNSGQKSDIVLDIRNSDIEVKDEGFAIKSYLGSAPTLLNASGNTNFIFELKGITKDQIDAINNITKGQKLKGRISKILELGGQFIYRGAEKPVMDYNLRMCDSFMPEIVGKILLSFYQHRINKVSEITEVLSLSPELSELIPGLDKNLLKSKVSTLLVNVLLGMFAGDKWDGSYLAKGAIILKTNGDCLGFHVIDIDSLKEYMFKNIKLDTPSTTRHRYGSAYVEGDKVFFKLNMQLRF